MPSSSLLISIESGMGIAAIIEKLQAGEICGLWEALSLSMSKSPSAKHRIHSGSSSLYNEDLVLGYLALSCSKNPELLYKHGFCELLTYVYTKTCRRLP